MNIQIHEAAYALASVAWTVSVDAALKSSIILMAAWAATLVMRRASAAMRHLVWALAVCAILTLPLLSGLLPKWRILPAWMGQKPAASAAAVAARLPAVAPAMVDSIATDTIPRRDSAGLPRTSTGFDVADSALNSTGPVDPAVRTDRPVATVVAPDASQTRWTHMRWQSWIAIGWACGTAILLLPVLVSIIGLWRMGRRLVRIEGGSWARLSQELAGALNLHRPVMLLRGRRQAMPMTWGILRPKLLLPPEAEDWSMERRRVVLMHELAHIKRGDFLTQLIAHLARAIYWFNPLVWMASKQIALESEGACDDLVLARQTRASDYAEHLLAVAAGLKGGALFSSAAVAMARSSRLEARLLGILDAKRNRSRVTVAGTVLVGLLLATLIVPVAALRAGNGSDGAPLVPGSSPAPARAEATHPATVITAEGGKVAIEASGNRLVAERVEIAQSGGAGWLAGSHQAAAGGAGKKSDVDSREGFLAIERIARLPAADQAKELDHLYHELAPPYMNFMLESILSSAPGNILDRNPANGFNGNDALWASQLANAASKLSPEEVADKLQHRMWLDIASRARALQVFKAHAKPIEALIRADLKSGQKQSVSRACDVIQSLDLKTFTDQLLALMLAGGETSEPANNALLFGHDPAIVQPLLARVDRDPKLLIRCSGLFQGPLSRKPADTRLLNLLDSPDADVRYHAGYALCECSDPKLSGMVSKFAQEDEPRFRTTAAYIATHQAPDVFATMRKDLAPLLHDKDEEVRFAALRCFSQHKDAASGPVILEMLKSEHAGAAGQGEVVIMQALDAFAGEQFGYDMHNWGPRTRGNQQAIQEFEAWMKQPNHAGERDGADALPPSNGPGRGELAGSVTDEAGKPLAGVLVDVWTWCPGDETTTDQQGRFILRKLGPEPVEIRFSKEGFGPWYNHIQPTGVADLQVKLSSRTYFEGLVKGPDGNPVSNAVVRADSGPKHNPGVEITTVWTETRSDQNGQYRLYVMPDAYVVQVRVPKVGAVRLPKTQISEGDARKLDIHLLPGVTFQAIAVDSESGLPISDVRLSHWEHKGVEGTSGKDGKIVIDGMSAGLFTFNVRARGYTRWWSAQAAQPHQKKVVGDSLQRNFDDLQFEVTDDLAPVKIELEREVRITGVVQDPDGNPVAGATVAPADGTGNSLTGDTRYSVATAKDGRFVMTLPASGNAKYNLEAHDGGHQQWRKWANGILPPIQTKPGDELKNVVIKLTRPATVRGHVKDETGKPLVDREVRASAADRLENRYYDPTTTTDKNGNFELRFVRPGDQYIQAAPFFWTNVPPGGMTLKLKKGETNSAQVTLKEGETKTGVELTGPASTAFPSFEEQLRQAIERSEKHPATQPKAPGIGDTKKEGAAAPALQPSARPVAGVKPADNEARLEVLKAELAGARAEAALREKEWNVGVADDLAVQAARSRVAVLEAGLTGDVVRVAQAKLVAARTQLEIIERSYRVGTLSELDYQKARSAVAVAEAELRVAMEERHRPTATDRPATGPGVASSKKTAERVATLKADLRHFALDLQYSGQQRNPYYRLRLNVPAVAAVGQENPFDFQTQITEAQAGKIIDYLAADGFLDQAFSLSDWQIIPKASEPGYSMTAGGFYADLGWNLAMLKRLDGLQSVLEGDAAKNMDSLLGRLSGERKQWTPPAAGAPAQAAANYADLAKLRSEWKVASVEGGGAFRWRAVAVGDSIGIDHVSLQPGGSLSTSHDYYVISPLKALKEIDVTFWVENLFVTQHGIYQLDEDTLTLCVAPDKAERPAKLAAVDGKSTLIVLKRAGAVAADSKSIEMSGHVVDDATGKPVSNFSVQGGHVDDKDPTKINWGYSLETRGNNPKGVLSTNVSGWSAGWRARVVASGYLPQPILTELPNDDAVAITDLVIRLKRGRQVSGHVLDHAGKPVNDAGVYVVGSPSLNLTGGKAMELAGGFVEDTKAIRVATDADGAFTVTGIGDDAQRIAITSSAIDLWVVPVPKGDGADSLEIRLPQPGKLVVHYDIPGAPEHAKLLLQLHTWEMPGWSGVTDDRYDPIQQHVEFVLDNLPPGDYTIDRSKNPGLKSQWEQVLLDRRSFKIESGKTTVTDFVRPTGAPIVGQVIGLDQGEVAKSKPTRVYVHVEPPQQDRLRPLIFDTLAMEAGNKPMDGKFTTERIPPGKYKVRAEVFIPETAEQMRSTGEVPPAFEGEAVVTVPEQGVPDPIKIQLAPFKFPER